MDSDKNIADMDVEEIKLELKELGIEFHHRAGPDKLTKMLTEVRAGTYDPEVINTPAPVRTGPTAEATAAAEAHTYKIKNPTKQQRALAVQRIVVTPNDPLMSTYSGLIFTVGSSAVNKGRVIKKFVPFNRDAGWHAPQIIIDQIEGGEMQKFKTIKLPNGQNTMQAYISKKFNVQILPPLTQDEMDSLGAAQLATGGIK
jgi:hypothetical protein